MPINTRPSQNNTILSVVYDALKASKTEKLFTCQVCSKIYVQVYYKNTAQTLKRRVQEALQGSPKDNANFHIIYAMML